MSHHTQFGKNRGFEPVGKNFQTHPNLFYFQGMEATGKTVTRDELYAAVWSKTLKALATEWNTNYPHLVRACDAMEVPRPSPSYWPSLALGYTVEKDPLNVSTDTTPKEWVLLPPGVREKKSPPRIIVRVDASDVAATPPPKTITAATQPAEANPAPEKKPATDTAIIIQNAVLDMIRRAHRIDFWKSSLSEKLYPRFLAQWAGLPKESKISEERLAKSLNQTRKNYETFEVLVTEHRDSRYYQQDYHLVVEIRLRAGSEWVDACKEAWALAEQPNEYGLTENALRLYLWAKSPKNNGQPFKIKSICLQAKLRKTHYFVASHLYEIRAKADPTIRWNPEDPGREALRIWFESTPVKYYHHGPLNPPLALNLHAVHHADLEKFRVWLYQEIQKPEFPNGREIVGLYDIGNRKTLQATIRVLPDSCGRYSSMGKFFETLRLIEDIQIQYRFDDGYAPWIVTCQPKADSNWQQIKARLKALAERVPLEQRYFLSPDGIALLQWIQELRTDEFQTGLTPVVEEHLGKTLSFKAKWDFNNTRTYLELLVGEINENTEYQLRALDWRHYSNTGTRILVKQKKTELQDVVWAIQALGLQRNKLLTKEKVSAALDALLAES